MAEGGKVATNGGRRNSRDKARAKVENSVSGVSEAGGMEGIPECAVCLQNCVHPARLPCSHIFCFLCLKGLATQSRRCAMCRQDIPPDYIDHPDLLDVLNASQKEAFEDGYQWFYEGRSGWWQYDERTSRELEIAYKSGQRISELLIVGQLYIADFDAMLQLRKSDLSRRRRIKRDIASIPIKGIAGLRLEEMPSTADESNDVTNVPSTSELAVSNQCKEADEAYSQTVACSNVSYVWQTHSSNLRDSEDDEAGDGDVESGDSRNTDNTDLEVKESFEGPEHEIEGLLMTQDSVLEERETNSESNVLFQIPRIQNLSLG